MNDERLTINDEQFSDICELRGITKNSEFTTEKLFENRRMEQAIEDEVPYEII
jgi:hypothetical protein